MSRFRPLALTALALFAGLLAWASKEFTLPPALHAKTYPAHDEHPQEHVTIAIDPYDIASKAAIFHVDWRNNDYLPVHFIVSNDGDQPISLTHMSVELITANRSKIQPSGNDELFRRLGRTKRRGDEPSRNPLPVPLPRRGPDVGVNKEARQEVETAQFKAFAVEPHTSQSGFFFFDVQGIAQPLPGAHLYVTGLEDANGQDLIYFEISLEKYLNSAPAK